MISKRLYGLNCTSANGKQNSYRHATTRANMHPFRNLTLYLSTKVTFTAVFTLNFTQWSSQFPNAFFGSELTNSQGALLPVYSSTVDRLQISQCCCCPSYKKRTHDINVFLMLTCKCTPTNISNKSDVCVTIVYKYYRFWSGLGYKEVTELWKQKWKSKSLGPILRFGKLTNTDSMSSTCIQFLMKSTRYSTDQESQCVITNCHWPLL